MEKKNGRSKKARINIELTTFEIPPSGDILVLGKRCPIGVQAAKRMLDAVAPNQFELIQMEDEIIEGILVKKHLFLRTEKESLIKTVVEEAKAIMGTDCMIKIKCEVTVIVSKEIQG